jgi:RNA polymerase sigma factor (sigma-70 family)
VTVAASSVEDRLRELAPQVLGALVRRYGSFDACEDAVQEALLAAALQWPHQGLPANPRGWLVTVASRRMVDELRSREARRRREDSTAALAGLDAALAPAADTSATGDHDDTLALLFLCCHPAITPASQLALTLRAVGGLTTAEIAAAFLVPESTIGQRISRAKATIRAAGATFETPQEPEQHGRLEVVLHVLYLIFNEGYTATAGADLQRVELSTEAIRLTRAVHHLRPDDDEVAGLLALMLLTDARRPARTDEQGGLVPLAQQDRGRWDQEAIAEGTALVTRALPGGDVGPYQLQAAIAAVHDEAEQAEATDWPQIVALYEVLARVAPNPMATLNRAVAVGMASGPDAGLELLATLEADERVADHHRVAAVRAHLLEGAGRADEARGAYLAAARRTTSTPERRYLEAQAARLTP